MKFSCIPTVKIDQLPGSNNSCNRRIDMLLGSHVSIAGGLHKAFPLGEEIGCRAIQIFTKNANRWKAKALQDLGITQFKEAWNTSKIHTVIAHDSYLINLGSPKADLLQKSQQALRIELERCEQLGIPFLVMHPGSHVGTGEEEGLRKVIQSFDLIHQQTQGYTTKILVETTAGQGTNLGYRFEHVANILDGVQASGTPGGVFRYLPCVCGRI